MEPRINATILVPSEYLGEVLKLCHSRRGIQQELTFVGDRAMASFDLPLNEIVFDFYDRLKSVSKGYASFDYSIKGYRKDNLVRMQILVNSEPVDALSTMVHRDNCETRGRAMCEKLKELIPRHLFKIPVQAAVGGRVVARETISALRKDVTAKCYGGDITRKKKLLGKAEVGKEAHAAIRQGRDSAASVHQRLEGGSLVTSGTDGPDAGAAGPDQNSADQTSSAEARGDIWEDRSKPICTISPSGARRAFGIAMLAALGAMFIWIGFVSVKTNIAAAATFGVLGIASFWCASVVFSATSASILLLRKGLVTSDDIIVAELDNIKAVERGLFALKPSSGFVILLKKPMPLVWKPGFGGDSVEGSASEAPRR